ncbi:MAG: hypothetical protein ACTSPY_15030 [Candidatus Helarchaeota archaeon]
MKKIERVYRELLSQFFEYKINKFTQKNIATKCNIAISTVNYALNPIQRMNAIEKRLRSFTIINPSKIIIYWASIRNLPKDIIYSTYVSKTIIEIESEIPHESLYTAYSCYKFKYKLVPTDYSEVYIYSKELEKIKNRFPKIKKMKPNLYVLQSDSHLELVSKKNLVPDNQLFVDLWNINTWYAEEFLKELRRKLKIGILD